jgi:hypothetical protein
MHDYSAAGGVGGGIARRSCSVCGFVQIDIRDTEMVSDTDLFTEPKLATMFTVEALLAKVSEEFVTSSRSFGEAPAGRRRPAKAFG